MGNELKKWVLEFQDFRNEVQDSLAAISFKMRVFKEQLRTIGDLLLQFTTSKASLKAKRKPPTNKTISQQDRDFIYHRIFGAYVDFDDFCEEGDYENI